ncbi:class I poly(R)-hydroxyalkanoic acid synthase [Paracoccus aerodenitrificans]|uniref:class I poly(R)-hydroxyalkanoic acid synthase n=1 Tax=Paracoccus aerodenitrificans TaxID=3017781 RepID=UPI0022F0F988|nr:class I poly(R)-hydroxyalkanoic acid synthase [Paracoccus aerodenitrificans]WBU65241.1 class I poly(R)-hydroxyalkanoic acid synthase [Paracoccus aerodenitrificans]
MASDEAGNDAGRGKDAAPRKRPARRTTAAGKTAAPVKKPGSTASAAKAVTGSTAKGTAKTTGRAKTSGSRTAAAAKSPSSRRKPATAGSAASQAKASAAKSARVAPPAAAEVDLQKGASVRSSDAGAKAAAASSGGSAAAGVPEAPAPAASSQLAENMERIESLTQRLAAAFAQRPMHDPGVEAPGADLMVNAGLAWAKMWTEQPARILEQQVKYWGATLAHYAEMQSQFVRGKLTAPEDDKPESDKRFRNPLWQSHPYFNTVKTQYQINAQAMRDAAGELDMLDPVDQHRLGWLTNQIIDMFAPTNFFATNPDAIERALETEGESLVKGLENLVRDVELNKGEMVVSLADRDAFCVGENIGTAPGRVVRQERLYELIQFSPTTEKVHATPIVIFPPWINKFYILDLKPENSLIRWIVDQGYTLFVVSWVNPDASFAGTGLEDYVSAYLSVMDAVEEITAEPKLNAIGYCIGGTTLSLTLALMAQRGDDRVNAATFFTTLTDFSEQGEFTPFLQDDFVEGIASEIERSGIFASHLMSRTMSFLRANDLVWGPAIRSYLMGEAPPAFDLLYWNGDATNLPGKMTVDYLRGLCQKNLLAGDGFPIMEHRVKISDITLPLCAIGCETDHIAPWKYSWRGVKQMGSKDKRFILSESGHIAGIVNPPSKKKYGHYTGGEDFSGEPENWKDAAEFTPGSWWPTWESWLKGFSGELVDAREPEEGFSAAPGSYVHQKY